MKFPKGPAVRVSVRKEHITTAVEANSTKCWIAEAVRAAIPKAQNVAVDVATTRFSDLEAGYRYVYLTPYAAQKALLEFDEGITPAPFSFLLRNAHVTRAGTQPATKARRANTKAKRQKHHDPVQMIRTERDAEKGALPRRAGGKRPPQLRSLRQFGVRAFRGASKARLEALAGATK
jgi:hypothetical protein